MPHRSETTVHFRKTFVIAVRCLNINLDSTETGILHNNMSRRYRVKQQLRKRALNANRLQIVMNRNLYHYFIILDHLQPRESQQQQQYEQSQFNMIGLIFPMTILSMLLLSLPLSQCNILNALYYVQKV